MANIQNKNFEQCDLCSNPVEHHCNLCHVDLCLNCKSNHLADKTKKHEIVEIMYRREEPVLSEVLNAIQNQEDAICKRVREIASQLMAEAVKNQNLIKGTKKSNLVLRKVIYRLCLYQVRSDRINFRKCSVH